MLAKIAPPLCAQHVLMAKSGDRLNPIVAVQERTPFALIDGQRVKAKVSNLVFQPAAVFQKGFVVVAGWKVHPRFESSAGYGINSEGTGLFPTYSMRAQGANWECELTADRDLRDCYAVFEATNASAPAVLSLPDLKAGMHVTATGLFYPG